MIQRLINTSDHNDLGAEGGDGLGKQLVLKWLETERKSARQNSPDTNPRSCLCGVGNDLE